MLLLVYEALGKCLAHSRFSIDGASVAFLRISCVAHGRCHIDGAFLVTPHSTWYLAHNRCSMDGYFYIFCVALGKCLAHSRLFNKQVLFLFLHEAFGTWCLAHSRCPIDGASIAISVGITVPCT